jgi:long-chain acyl-CoA synthetase
LVREIQSIGALFLEQAATHPERPVFIGPEGSSWSNLSLSEASERMHRIAYGLMGLGVEKGECVALLSGPRLEWPLVDWAVMVAGGISVPIYPKQNQEQTNYILGESAARICVVENTQHLEKVLRNKSKLRDLEHIVLIDPDAGEDAPTMDEILARHTDLGDGFLWTLDALAASAEEKTLPKISPDNVATIVYTAGTTEEPKGVVITHDNLLFVSAALHRALQFSPNDRIYWFLPLAHIMGRVVLLVGLRAGVPVAFPRATSSWVEDVTAIRPTILPGVPRVYQDIRARFLSRIAQSNAFARLMARWALSVGRDYGEMVRTRRAPGLWLRAQYWIAKRMIFGKLKRWFGGQVRILLSGGARLSEDVAAWYHNAGMTILEGYGLTESTAVTHVNRKINFKFGTVGPPLDGIEVRLDEDGEVLVRGRGVMKSYFERSSATKMVLDEEGWLRTGDIGQIDSEGFLTITDRKKELVIMASGRNVAPEPIEAKLCDSNYVSQAFIHGEERGYLSVLLTLNPDAITTWAHARGIESDSYEKLIEHGEVHALVQDTVNAVNRSLASYETIRKFAVLPDEFSLDAGALTPTFKLRRKAIEKQYESLLDSFYSDSF